MNVLIIGLKFQQNDTQLDQFRYKETRNKPNIFGRHFEVDIINENHPKLIIKVMNKKFYITYEYSNYDYFLSYYNFPVNGQLLI